MPAPCSKCQTETFFWNEKAGEWLCPDCIADKYMIDNEELMNDLAGEE